MKYTKDNQKIEYILFILSTIISFFLMLFFRKWLSEIILNEIVLILIIFSLSLIIGKYCLFDFISKFFFKIPFMKNIIPDFNGTWKGKGKSSFEKTNEFEVNIEIKQTLTDISINAQFNLSKSEAFSTHISKENNKSKLFYNYFNQPDNTNDNLDKHYGTVILEKNNNELKGNYFTDRKLQTKGTFELKNK